VAHFKYKRIGNMSKQDLVGVEAGPS